MVKILALVCALFCTSVNAQIENPSQPTTAGTGLSKSGTALSVTYGTTSGTALQGNTRAAANGVASLDGSTLIPTAQLPIVPVTKGGSGTSTTFSQGSVLYAGASGIYSQDVDFGWDAINNILQLGGSYPFTNKTTIFANRSNPSNGILAHFADSSGSGGAGISFGRTGSSAYAIVHDASGQLSFFDGQYPDGAGTLRMRLLAGAFLIPGIASGSGATTGTLCWTTGTGNVTVNTTLACLSSALRFKQHILPLDDGITTVMKLKPVSYELRPEYDTEHLGRQVGLIAEDVELIDKRLVGYGSDKKIQGVRYMQLTAVLIRAIQDQQRQIARLERKLKSIAHD
jgi:hypothetical protein